MFCVLILRFLFWFVVTYPKCMCKSLEKLSAPRKKHWLLILICYWLLTFRMKSFSFWKLLVLQWKSSNVAPFMEHPWNIIFSVEKVLNLACWFSFDTSCLNFMFKTYLFLNFACSAKKASIFFFLWNTLYSQFAKCLDSWLLILLCLKLPKLHV